MDVNRSDIEDVKHELRIRGISEFGDEEQMRKVLKKLLGLELETGVSMIKEKINVEEEEKDCRSKIVELRDQIPEYSGRYNDAKYKKIMVKITNLYNRLERFPSGSVQKDSLIQEVNDLKLSLDIKASRPSASKDDQHPEESADPVEVKQKHESTSSSSDSSAIHPAYIPVSQWKVVKYTGDNPRVSLGQFLLTLEDKCKSRHVDKVELFESAADLFEGTALIYYRYIRNRVKSWSELESKLREVFQGPYYDERLMEEIKDRKQGPNEPITIYLAKMDNYFRRLSELPSEKDRLKIIERNLHPFFLKHLSHVDYNTLLELEEIGKKLERGKKLADGFHKFTTENKLEPDLAYRNPAGKFKKGTLGAINQNAICWYCHRPGHRYQDCDQNDDKSD